MNANSGDKISFYWKVSSEQNGDYLEFYIDGGNYQDRISGDVDWQKKTYTLSSGSHTLKWRFIRNGDTDGGEDCGWVDFVQWTQASPVQDPNNWNTITYKYDPSGRRIKKRFDDQVISRRPKSLPPSAAHLVYNRGPNTTAITTSRANTSTVRALMSWSV